MFWLMQKHIWQSNNTFGTVSLSMKNGRCTQVGGTSYMITTTCITGQKKGEPYIFWLLNFDFL